MQSGVADSTPLWDAGFTGGGEFVQVCDTGVDDASCWFRSANTSDELTGDYSSAAQVARSSWSRRVRDIIRIRACDIIRIRACDIIM